MNVSKNQRVSRVRNRQSRDTGNNGHTRYKKRTNKQHKSKQQNPCYFLLLKRQYQARNVSHYGGLYVYIGYRIGLCLYNQVFRGFWNWCRQYRFSFDLYVIGKTCDVFHPLWFNAMKIIYNSSEKTNHNNASIPSDKIRTHKHINYDSSGCKYKWLPYHGCGKTDVVFLIVCIFIILKLVFF